MTNGDALEHRILIVEDNPLNMELATDILVAAGHTVLQAEDGSTAIALVKSEKPALVLMDVSLPGMDGLQTTAVLKRDPQTKDIPVIALTAHAMKGDRESALAAGCDDYLTKPIDAKLLFETIRRFIDSQPADTA